METVPNLLFIQILQYFFSKVMINLPIRVLAVRSGSEVGKARATISMFIYPVEQQMMILLTYSGVSFYQQQKRLNLNSF